MVLKTDIVVEFHDLRTGESLATRTVDLAAESSVTVQVPWVPAQPDSHEIQVRISPYVLDESDYTNNTASRVFVLGSLVDAEPGGAPRRLRFDPPYPNPASRDVAFSFAVPRSSTGELGVYDILGRRVRVWRWASLAVLSLFVLKRPVASLPT